MYQTNEHFGYFKCACFSVYASQGRWTADSGHSFARTISIDNIRYEIWTLLLGNGAKKLFLWAFKDVFFFHSTRDQIECIICIYSAPMIWYCFYFFRGKKYLIRTLGGDGGGGREGSQCSFTVVVVYKSSWVAYVIYK